MNPLRIRLLALACLLATLGAVSGCANFPANKPSALPPPNNDRTVAP